MVTHTHNKERKGICETLLLFYIVAAKCWKWLQQVKLLKYEQTWSSKFACINLS